MNAHTPIEAATKPFTPARPWHWASGVIECDTCDGVGSYWNGRGMGGNDPDSWMIDCPHCDATGHHPCEVCGFDTHTKGYDCLVCSTVEELTADELAKIDAGNLAAAFTAAIAARIAGSALA